MKEICIDTRISEALNLSHNERFVFDVLKKYPIGRRVTHIAKDAGLSRTTVIYVLRSLEKRKLAEKVSYDKKTVWKYKNGLEYIHLRSIGEK